MIGGSGLAAALDAREIGRSVVLPGNNEKPGRITTGRGGLLKGHDHHRARAYVPGRRAGRDAAFATATA